MSKRHHPSCNVGCDAWRQRSHQQRSGSALHALEARLWASCWEIDKLGYGVCNEERMLPASATHTVPLHCPLQISLISHFLSQTVMQGAAMACHRSH